MTFDDAVILLRDGKFTHLKILDAEGKRLYDLNATSAEDLIQQLEQYKNILATYGRIKFLVANESIFKQNWKECYQWIVTFAPTNSLQGSNMGYPGSLPGHGMAGYISANEAALMSKLEGLTRQIEFDKRFNELSKKLDGNKGFDIQSALPFLGMFVDMDEKKLQSMMALAQIQGLSKGMQPQQQPQGMAGLQELKTELKTTEGEKEIIDGINEQMGQLSEKVELANILEFVRTLNEKPELLQNLISMAKNFK